jgi:hypothetical protein
MTSAGRKQFFSGHEAIEMPNYRLSHAHGTHPNLAPDELPEVQVEWVTSASIWEALENLQNKMKEGVALPEDFPLRDPLVLGPVSGDLDSRFVRVSAMKANAPDGKMLHWALTTSDNPEGVPQDIIDAFDRNLGGREGLLNSLTEILIGPKVLIATYSIRLHLSSERWRCVLMPGQPREADQQHLRDISSHIEVEHIGYRIRDGAHGIEEIILGHLPDESIYYADITARGGLRLLTNRGRFLPFVDDVLELAIERLFTREA